MNKIKVCQIKISYNRNLYHVFLQSLNDVEKYYLMKYKDVKRRYESLVGIMLVKYLAREEGIEPGTLLHTPQGKPKLEGYNGAIAITHTEGNVIVAVSASLKELGIDLENNIIANIDKNIFLTSKEQALRIPGLTETEQLTTIWTLKEAYVKYKGMGFLLDPTDIEFLYRDDKWYIEGQNLYTYSCKLAMNKIFSLVTNQPFIIILEEMEEQYLL